MIEEAVEKVAPGDTVDKTTWENVIGKEFFRMLGRSTEDQVEIMKTWKDAVNIIKKGNKNWQSVTHLEKRLLIARLVHVCDEDAFYRDSVLAIMELPQQFPTGFFM